MVSERPPGTHYSGPTSSRHIRLRPGAKSAWGNDLQPLHSVAGTERNDPMLRARLTLQRGHQFLKMGVASTNVAPTFSTVLRSSSGRIGTPPKHELFVVRQVRLSLELERLLPDLQPAC